MELEQKQHLNERFERLLRKVQLQHGAALNTAGRWAVSVSPFTGPLHWNWKLTGQSWEECTELGVGFYPPKMLRAASWRSAKEDQFAICRLRGRNTVVSQQVGGGLHFEDIRIVWEEVEILEIADTAVLTAGEYFSLYE